jgi:hypothetical protein
MFNRIIERQPDSISCGPACVKMVTSLLLSKTQNKTNFSVMMIRDVMGTNSQTGTTEKEMEKGLQAFGIDFRRYTPTPDQSEGGARLNGLKSLLSEGNTVLLRVMKHGCRHWIYAVGNTEKGVLILDPGIGQVQDTSMRQIADMMAPRGWEMWKISANSPCRALNISLISDHVSPASTFMNLETLLYKTFSDNEVDSPNYRSFRPEEGDANLSFVLYDNNKILGAYMLNQTSTKDMLVIGGYDETKVNSISEHTIKMFPGKKGAEALMIILEKEMRGLGLGHLLKKMPGNIGIEYTYGFQSKALPKPNVKNGQLLVDMGDAWYYANPVQQIRPMHIGAGSTATKAEFPKQLGMRF